MKTGDVVSRAFYKSFPVMAGYVVLGIGFGILLRNAGYGVLWAFSMTALFIASFTEQWITSKDHIPALTGLLCTALCLVIFGAEKFLIPSMLLITFVLTIIRKREDVKT